MGTRRLRNVGIDLIFNRVVVDPDPGLLWGPDRDL
jgi:hypothetical protein